jgi:hypothetical protein
MINCPFCDSERVKAITENFVWYGACFNCSACGPIADSKKLAIKRWNTRPYSRKRRITNDRK